MATSTIPASAPYPIFRGSRIIEFVERAVPPAGPGQLLIQCKANALCASDLGQYFNGATIAPGHEATGIVAAAGPGTTTSVGTPGVVFLMDYCGTCRSCRLGLTNQCLEMRADYGFSHDGGYGPYALINEHVFFPIDTDIAMDDATMLLDVMGTGGHAVVRGVGAHTDVQSLLITGAGPIGLGVLAMAKIILGRDFPVLISDMVPYRLSLAEALGGLPIDIGNGSVDAGARRHGYGEVDLAIDTSGVTSARRGAIELLAMRGVLVCVGHGGELNLTVSPDLIGKERSILGSEYFCYGELAENLERFREHRAYVTQIVTHRFPVTDIGAAYDAFTQKNTGKVVVVQ
jgi:threonine 3-dehydrogenase